MEEGHVCVRGGGVTCRPLFLFLFNYGRRRRLNKSNSITQQSEEELNRQYSGAEMSGARPKFISPEWRRTQNKIVSLYPACAAQ